MRSTAMRLKTGTGDAHAGWSASVGNMRLKPGLGDGHAGGVGVGNMACVPLEAAQAQKSWCWLVQSVLSMQEKAG
eukprot:scaffold51246_cov22-Tisochrysis_lutea.AAC.1